MNILWTGVQLQQHELESVYVEVVIMPKLYFKVCKNFYFPTFK